MKAIETVRATLARGPMTAKDIQAATGLPRRTVFTALRSLQLSGALQRRLSLRDTRQSWFWLAQ